MESRHLFIQLQSSVRLDLAHLFPLFSVDHSAANRYSDAASGLSWYLAPKPSSRLYLRLIPRSFSS